MSKYILRESELKSVLRDIIMEEISNATNEGVLGRLGNMALNTAKWAGLATLAPGLAAGKAMEKIGGIVDPKGKDTVAGTADQILGGGAGAGRSSSGGKSGGKKLSRTQQRNERYKSAKYLAQEWGRPETVPGWGRRVKLERKREIENPMDTARRVIRPNGTLYNITMDWGAFGRHYHDEGERGWLNKVEEIEERVRRAATRDGTVDPDRQARFQRRYRRALADWLNKRDKAYESWIEENPKLI